MKAIIVQKQKPQNRRHLDFEIIKKKKKKSKRALKDDLQVQ